jgi:energy-coupling factor transporter ATP-binding protein EcfA2
MEKIEECKLTEEEFSQAFEAGMTEEEIRAYEESLKMIEEMPLIDEKEIKPSLIFVSKLIDGIYLETKYGYDTKKWTTAITKNNSVFGQPIQHKKPIWTDERGRDSKIFDIMKSMGIKQSNCKHLFFNAIEAIPYIDKMLAEMESRETEIKLEKPTDKMVYDALVNILSQKKNSLVSSNDREYIRFPIYDDKDNISHWNMISLSEKSDVMGAYMSKFLDVHFGEINSTNYIKNITPRLKFEALRNKVKLSNRVEQYNGNLYYDLSNQKGEFVEITKNGWRIIDEHDNVIFLRQQHMKPQFYPISEGDPLENVKRIFKYINVKDEADQLLILMFLFTFFSAEEHVILFLDGEGGSGKSTVARVLKSILDPSILEDGDKIPEDMNSLIQILSHHKFSVFGNISSISQQVSDIMCEAITGISATKRAHWTNDSDFLYKFMCSISLNGIIGEIGDRADILTRTIRVTTSSATFKERHDGQLREKMLAEDLPYIMGGIFDIMSKAIAEKEKETEIIDPRYRSVSFLKWSKAVCKATGLSYKDFENKYKEIYDQIDEKAIENNPQTSAILELMMNRRYWSGTMTELKKELEKVSDIKISSSTVLSHNIKKLLSNLKNIGIEISWIRNKNGRKIEIRNINITGEEKNKPSGIKIKIPEPKPNPEPKPTEEPEIEPPDHDSYEPLEFPPTEPIIEPEDDDFIIHDEEPITPPEDDYDDEYYMQTMPSHKRKAYEGLIRARDIAVRAGYVKMAEFLDIQIKNFDMF